MRLDAAKRLLRPNREANHGRPALSTLEARLTACRTPQRASQGPTGAQLLGGAHGVIRQDAHCACSLECEKTFHHCAVSVEPAVGGRRLEHRVFAGHLIGEGRRPNVSATRRTMSR